MIELHWRIDVLSNNTLTTSILSSSGTNGMICVPMGPDRRQGCLAKLSMPRGVVFVKPGVGVTL
jgi:hypothetical protein